MFIRILALFCYVTCQGATAAEKPNILWIMAEDMGRDLSCYGAPDVRTPHLDKLASEGILCRRAYCTNPICSPSRSAMMLGVHQTVSGTHHHRSGRSSPLKPPFVPITKTLRDAGYTCLLGHSLARGRGRKTDCNFKSSPIGPWDGAEQFGLFDAATSQERQISLPISMSSPKPGTKLPTPSMPSIINPTDK